MASVRVERMRYSDLQRAVAGDAALRRRQRLQPAGGQGDKIFPPTYPGEGRNPQPRHVLERRRVDGRDVWCALVDSVQSQAHRMEEALLAAVNDGSVAVPHVVVDFSGSGLTGIETITSLDAPHRVYDAILRDSLLDGTPFPKSDLGRRLAECRPVDATALLEASPTALLFGAWNSTGEGGGLGAKFPRAVVSEIAAFGVSMEHGEADVPAGEARASGWRPGSRIDPLGIGKGVPIYQSAADPKDWTAFENEAATKGKNDPVLFSRKKGDKAGKPSVINHGNVTPSLQPLGITCDYAEHMAVISCAGLRRLGFGGGERDAAGRTLLAALGLLALAEQDARGYALRSRCDLVCEGRAPLQQVHADGTTDAVDLDRSGARALYAEALSSARDAGFDLRQEPVRLTPQPKLIAIVRESQRLALAGEGGEADADAGA